MINFKNMQEMKETIVPVTNNNNWDKVITAKKRLLDLHLKDVWDYRYLIKMFIKRDFVVAYKQTILGPIWYLVQPLITAFMYMFVFGQMAQVGTDGIPHILFYFAGTMLWTYFTSCLNSCAATFTTNQAVFGKVYFPRLTAPVANCGFHIIKLAIQFLLLAVKIIISQYWLKTVMRFSAPIRTFTYASLLSSKK